LAATLVGRPGGRQFVYRNWQNATVYKGTEYNTVVCRLTVTFNSVLSHQKLLCQCVMQREHTCSHSATDGRTTVQSTARLGCRGTHNNDSVSAKRSCGRRVFGHSASPLPQVHLAVPGNAKASAVNEQEEAMCNHTTVHRPTYGGTQYSPASKFRQFF